MNKNSILLIMLLVCSSITFSQTKEDALRDAKITADATLKMDFETVLKHTYPGVLTIMGGKEKAIDLLKTTFDTMISQGFVFEKADVINVSEIVKEQGQYRCYVEGFNQIKMTEMRIKSKSYLLGIYDEDKKIWYYLEAKQLKNSALIDQVLPDFKTDLNIPDDDVATEPLGD